MPNAAGLQAEVTPGKPSEGKGKDGRRGTRRGSGEREEMYTGVRTKKGRKRRRTDRKYGSFGGFLRVQQQCRPANKK